MTGFYDLLFLFSKKNQYRIEFFALRNRGSLLFVLFRYAYFYSPYNTNIEDSSYICIHLTIQVQKTVAKVFVFFFELD